MSSDETKVDIAGKIIFSDDKKLNITFESIIDDIILFNMQDADAGTSENFTVAMKYYDSYYGVGQSSGDYIFRPTVNTPNKYSVTGSGTGLAENNQLKFFLVDQYADSDKQMVIILLDIDEDLRLPRLKVDLGSIEFDREIVIQFGINDFSNHDTFFTDSNGLEM